MVLSYKSTKPHYLKLMNISILTKEEPIAFIQLNNLNVK